MILELIARNEIPEVASLLAEALFDNSAYELVFSANNRRLGLEWLFERRLHAYYAKQCTYVVREDPTGPIVGTITVLPSDLTLSFFDMVRNGLFFMPFKFGVKSMRTMLALIKVHEAEVASVMKGQAHWMLAMVAVEASERQRGVGTEIMGLTLDLLRKRFPRLPIVLTTQSEANVRFYRRVGFDVAEARNVLFQGKHYFNWTMIDPIVRP